MSFVVEQSFRCLCNDRVYPNSASLKAHQKTKSHLAWQTADELRALKCELVKSGDKITELNSVVYSRKAAVQPLRRKAVQEARHWAGQKFNMRIHKNNHPRQLVVCQVWASGQAYLEVRATQS